MPTRTDHGLDFGRGAILGRGRRLFKAVTYGLVFAVPIGLLAFVVRERFLPVIEFDQATVRAATDFTRANPGLRTALIVWQEMTQPRWLYTAATAVCLVVWRRHQLATRAAWAFVTMMVAWNLQLVLKVVVQRARPVISDPVSHASGWSFPSGHAANAAAIATVLLLLLWPLCSPGARRVLVVVAVVGVTITMADRVFLGVHFPSDVVAGLLFGGGLALASYLGYLGWNPRSLDTALPPEGAVGPEPSKDLS